MAKRDIEGGETGVERRQAEKGKVRPQSSRSRALTSDLQGRWVTLLRYVGNKKVEVTASGLPSYSSLYRLDCELPIFFELQ